jgi:hypothetical protein
MTLDLPKRALLQLSYSTDSVSEFAHFIAFAQSPAGVKFFDALASGLEPAMSNATEVLISADSRDA